MFKVVCLRTVKAGRPQQPNPSRLGQRGPLSTMGSFATELDGRKSDEGPACRSGSKFRSRLLRGAAMRPLCFPMSLSSIARRSLSPIEGADLVGAV